MSGTFDAIWMFSLVTHLNPDDANAIFAILRRAVRPDGALLFSTFLDDEIDSYREDDPERTSAKVLYNHDFLNDLVTRNGWKVSEVYRRGTARYIVDHFMCRPVH